jgi:hypothetical protein
VAGNPVKLMSKREDVPVVHKLHQMRYHASGQWARLPALTKELKDGAPAIAEFAKATYGVTLAYSVETPTCC